MFLHHIDSSNCAFSPLRIINTFLHLRRNSFSILSPDSKKFFSKFIIVTNILVDSSCSQTCTNSRNTSIPPGVLSFQVVFVNKFNLKEDISLLLCWPVSEGLELISSRCMSKFHILSIYTCNIFVFRMLSLTKIVRPYNLKLVKTTAQSRYT